MSNTPQRFIQIDEEGYFLFNGVRVADTEFGRHMLAHLAYDDVGRMTTEAQGTTAFVEAFDEPLVALQIDKTESGWQAVFPYDYKLNFSLKDLTLDEWDRFHGRVVSGLPFVMSRKAQAQFFDSLEEFDDTGVFENGERIEIPDWLGTRSDISKPDFWSNIYLSGEKPGWELESPHPALAQIVPQLKWPKSRIIVLGSGSGNDAAFFAEQGHIVTAVDLSSEAIAQAREKYGHLKNINFVQSDLFDLPSELHGQFDIVFEHTCYCAVDPKRRNDLVRTWRRLLNDQGHLLGIFFVMDRPDGPPFGGSEWEVRQRLQKGFEFLYWTRWHHSPERRLGKELVVYAKNKTQ